jgi:hypothetical protein
MARAERESTQLHEVSEEEKASEEEDDEVDDRSRGESDGAEVRDKEEDRHDEEDRRDEEEEDRDGGEKEKDRKGRGDHQGPRKRLPGLQVFERGKEQLSVVTGRTVDSVTGFSPSDDGWNLTVEMVDIEKIPPTTSVMVTYEVMVDDEGNLLEYHLTSRYTRGQTKDEG